MPISRENRAFFKTLTDVDAVKRDLATGSGEILGFDPQRRRDAIQWVREWNARERRDRRWQVFGIFIVVALAVGAAVLIVKGQMSR